MADNCPFPERIAEKTFFEWQSRRLVFALLRYLPVSGQRGLTGLLKQIRRLVAVSSHHPLELYLSDSDKSLVPEQVCLTHDVDWASCYSSFYGIAEVEADFGFKSTFNFLTGWQYRPRKKDIAKILEDGFEVGLHGREHDIAMGVRSKPSLRKMLSEARDVLGGVEVVRGFRTPALAISEPLLDVLDELGFLYDSSVAAWSPYCGLQAKVRPYRYPNRQIWLLPLSLQDDLLFREYQLSDGEALQVVKAVMAMVASGGGVFVFNGHPTILSEHKEFYLSFLHYLAEREVKVVTADKVILGEIWKETRCPGASIRHDE